MNKKKALSHSLKSQLGFTSGIGALHQGRIAEKSRAVDYAQRIAAEVNTIKYEICTNNQVFARYSLTFGIYVATFYTP